MFKIKMILILIASYEFAFSDFEKFIKMKKPHRSLIPVRLTNLLCPEY